MDSVADFIDAADARLNGLRARQQEFATHFGLTLAQYLKIVKSCNTLEAITVLGLLKSTKFRSSYRETCAAKVRSWLETSVTSKPLAPWEFSRCAPKWRVSYSLPTF
jgi:hypothetical protein